MVATQKAEPCKFEYKRFNSVGIKKLEMKHIFEAGDVKIHNGNIIVDNMQELVPVFLTFDITSFIMVHTNKPILTNEGWEQIKILRD